LDFDSTSGLDGEEAGQTLALRLLERDAEAEGMRIADQGDAKDRRILLCRPIRPAKSVPIGPQRDAERRPLERWAKRVADLRIRDGPVDVADCPELLGPDDGTDEELREQKPEDQAREGEEQAPADRVRSRSRPSHHRGYPARAVHFGVKPGQRSWRIWRRP
jgi:hypothetical protein